MSQLVRELKRKRDEEARLAQRSPQPVFVATEGSQVIKAPQDLLTQAVTTLNSLKNAVTIAAGDNITVTVDEQAITITGLDNVLTGAAAPTTATEGTIGQLYLETTTPKVYICTAIDADTYTWTEVGAGAGGGSYTLPQATESELGGVKAAAKTSAETTPVKIDPATGIMYVPPADAAANGLPAGGIAGQVLAKASSVDYDTEWIDAPSGGGTMEIPIIFASSEFSDTYKASNAFDDKISTYWSASGAIGQYIGINFKRYVNVVKIYITDANNRLKDFVFEGSIDGNSYTELLNETRANVTTEVEYEIPESSDYVYYRLRCTGALYTGSNMTINELRMEYQV